MDTRSTPFGHVLRAVVAAGMLLGAASHAPATNGPTPPESAGLRLHVSVAADTTDHPELLRLFREDQADRTPPPNAPLEFFEGMQARDRERRARVLELYRADQLRTGADYYHAAIVLQH